MEILRRTRSDSSLDIGRWCRYLDLELRPESFGQLSSHGIRFDMAHLKYLSPLRALDSTYSSQEARTSRSGDYTLCSMSVPPNAPRRCAGCVEFVQKLFVPEGIHALPKAVMAV